MNKEILRKAKRDLEELKDLKLVGHTSTIYSTTGYSNLKNALDLLEQALTPPNLEELKQSIIDRLNEKYEVDPSNEDEAWYFVEESYKCGFTENNFYDEIYYYKEGIAPIIQMILPLDLAHDITLYFKEIEKIKSTDSKTLLNELSKMDL